MSSATVVGAGVFGASTARELAQRGWDVTLVEQYAPGTVRSASGGDTRLLRASHGSVDWYADLAWRARSAWLALQEETGTPIWEPEYPVTNPSFIAEVLPPDAVQMHWASPVNNRVAENEKPRGIATGLASISRLPVKR